MCSARTAWPLAAVLLVSGCFQSEAPRPVERPGPLATTEDADRNIRSVAERREAVYTIADSGEPVDTAFIAEALVDPDREVRQAAILTLAATGGETSAAWLALALNDADPELRLYAVEALADVGGASARMALQQALVDPDPAVRATAADVLQEPQRR